jgi:hypothetical protein
LTIEEDDGQKKLQVRLKLSLRQRKQSEKARSESLKQVRCESGMKFPGTACLG